MIPALTISETLEGERKCGNCALWGMNFYPHHDKTCCADVVMVLPASFIPARQTMEPEQGAECICWRKIGTMKS
jgi:hypothetical protein